MTLRIALLLGCLSLSAPAQFLFPPLLYVNQQFDASVALGSDMEVSVYTTPGVPLSIGFSLDPVPTSISGFTFPIGLGPSFVMTHVGVTVPPNGVFTDVVGVPNNPNYPGVTFYGMAVTADPTQPGGLGISPAISGTFTIPASAGPDTLGLIDEPIPLDGGGNLDGTGVIPGGAVVQWSIASGPAGHGAVIENADYHYPTLVADVPGLYTLECSMIAPGSLGGVVDDCIVSVYDLANAGPQHGAFLGGSTYALNVSAAGPPGATHEVVGVGSASVGVPISSSGALLPPITSHRLRVSGPNGQSASRGLSIVANGGASTAVTPPQSFALHLKQPAIDDVASVLETELMAYDLATAVVGSPPVNIAYVPGIFGITTFSADVSLVGLSYDPLVQLTLVPGTGIAHASATLTNTTMVFNVSGDVFGIGYSTVATLTMNTAVGNIDAAVTVNGGVYQTTPLAVSVNLSNVNLSFSSTIIDAFTSLFESAIIGEIETAIADTLGDAFPPLLDDFLNTIPQEIGLASVGVNAAFDFVPDAMTFAPGTFTIDMSAGAHLLFSSPVAINPMLSYSTPSAPPPFGAVTPSTGAPYTTGLALSDDSLNQALTALVRSGYLDFEYTGAIDVAGMVLDTNAGNMALLFPGLGFERFDPAALVYLAVHPTIVPVLLTNGPGSPSMATMTVADLEVELLVEPAPGMRVPVAGLGLTGDIDLDMSLDLVGGTLDFLTGNVAADAYARYTMPGVDASPLVAGLSFLLPALVPSLVSSFGSIPVPDVTGTGLGVGVVSVEAQGDYITVFTN